MPCCTASVKPVRAWQASAVALAPRQVALALALGEGLAHRLRCRLFAALLQRDTLFFDRVKTGQMTAWLGQDIEVLQVG